MPSKRPQALLVKCLPAVDACWFKGMGSLLDSYSDMLHADGPVREVLILATSPFQTTATSDMHWDLRTKNAWPVPCASMRQSCTLVESPLAWLSQDRRAMPAQFGFSVLARCCVSAFNVASGPDMISPWPPPNTHLGNENLILQPAVVGARVEMLSHFPVNHDP